MCDECRSQDCFALIQFIFLFGWCFLSLLFAFASFAFASSLNSWNSSRISGLLTLDSVPTPPCFAHFRCQRYSSAIDICSRYIPVIQIKASAMTNVMLIAVNDTLPIAANGSMTRNMAASVIGPIDAVVKNCTGCFFIISTLRLNAEYGPLFSHAIAGSAMNITAVAASLIIM